MTEFNYIQFQSILNRIATGDEKTIAGLSREDKEFLVRGGELIAFLFNIELERGPGSFIDLSEAQLMRKDYLASSQFFPDFMKFIGLQIGRDHIEDLLKFMHRNGKRADLFQIMPGLLRDPTTQKWKFHLITTALTEDKEFIFPKQMRTGTINGDVSDDYRPCPPEHCDDLF